MGGGKWNVRGEERSVQGVVGKVEGKRLIGRHRRRWVITLRRKKVGWNDLD